MLSLFVIPIALQLLVPVALLVWQASARDTNLISWLLKHGAACSYIYATTIAGLWLAAPWYAPHLLMVISISLAARTLAGALKVWIPPARPRQWFEPAVRAVAAAAGAGALWMALQGRTPPRETSVDLEFPLRAGRYYIANGGSTELLNAHVRMLRAERFRRYRGSSYGIDILGLNVFGIRASGIAPRDLARYVIFGDAIYSPCEGVAVRAEDGLPDLTPPEVDRAHMPGNFVLLECGDGNVVHVLLGHMKCGTVKVRPGDQVTHDTILGEVGNSGNSDEPHLHVHAQRPGPSGDPFGGDPLPIRFDGRYLVRNDRVKAPASTSDIIDD